MARERDPDTTDTQLRTRDWIEAAIRYENREGTHTYHACGCGRAWCRSIACPTCWKELLEQLQVQK